MEQAILEAEAAADAAQRAAEDPAVSSDAAALQERYAALEAARAEVERLYARWAELEAGRAEEHARVRAPASPAQPAVGQKRAVAPSDSSRRPRRPGLPRL